MRDRHPNTRPIPRPLRAPGIDAWSPIRQFPGSTFPRAHHSAPSSRTGGKTNPPQPASSCRPRRHGGTPFRPAREFSKTKPRVILSHPPKPAGSRHNPPKPPHDLPILQNEATARGLAWHPRRRGGPASPATPRKFAKRSHGSPAKARQTLPNSSKAPHHRAGAERSHSPLWQSAYRLLPTAYYLEKQNRESLAFRQTIPDLPRAT
jgi:hypothetical protein